MVDRADQLITRGSCRDAPPHRRRPAAVLVGPADAPARLSTAGAAHPEQGESPERGGPREHDRRLERHDPPVVVTGYDIPGLLRTERRRSGSDRGRTGTRSLHWRASSPSPCTPCRPGTGRPTGTPAARPAKRLRHLENRHAVEQIGVHQRFPGGAAKRHTIRATMTTGIVRPNSVPRATVPMSAATPHRTKNTPREVK